MSRRSWRWIPVVVLGMSLPWMDAAAQTLPGQNPPCGNVNQGDELQAPPEIAAALNAREVSTQLDVQVKPLCVPRSKNPDNTWSTRQTDLRTYVYTDPKTGQTRWGYPGPTLRLRKADEYGVGGQGIAVLLKNNLRPVLDDGACRAACPATQSCDAYCPGGVVDPAALEALINQKCRVATVGDPPKFPQECCCVAQCTQETPNCFHGENTTNLHFHGSHASPQAPQDFVLLNLRPNGSPPSDGHGSHGPCSTVKDGEYQYRVDPLGWKQPEGTHWYHPHKHGSVGGQVANGMAGAMIIDGPFDEWLKGYYTTEKLMVIQQIARQENFFFPQASAPQVLVNGQIQPKITVRPGEMQRWRMVNASMSSGAVISLALDPKLRFRQIAMDGVRFSPANYECQPLFNFNPRTPSFPCQPNPTGKLNIRIAPGNRADFLVRMPLTETPKGQDIRIERKLVNIQGEERGGGRQNLMIREEAIAPGDEEPALFTVVVDDGVPGNENQPRRRGLAEEAPKEFPKVADWPKMPDYLRNITDAEVSGNAVAMTFQQFISGWPTNNPNYRWPYSQAPISKFTIDGRQFDACCANVTTVIDKAMEWTVKNDTVLPHPFHIHTNPFQLYSVNGVRIQPQGQVKPEPIWMDTFSMPPATVNPATPPPSPATPISITTAPFVMRQRYEDFTGEYVLHCHFLGHEDRGMMFSVQTVCPDNVKKYGVPSATTPECRGVFGKDALDACE